MIKKTLSPAARLQAFRAELGAQNFDGFLVPRSDEHQGEYVSARSERLAWLTGFTGSAGLAVISQSHAAIFTDGRYTLQVETEVDANLYECLHLSDQPATRWICEHMSDGQTLGYDPWLFTPKQVKIYRDICQEIGIHLQRCNNNPIDAVWLNQPMAPEESVMYLDLKFTGETSAEKRLRISSVLMRDGADAVILTAPDSIAWLFNIRGGDVPFAPFALSFAILYSDGSADWFIDAMKIPANLRDELDSDIKVHPPSALSKTIDHLGECKKVVRADPASAAEWIHERLHTAGATLSQLVDPCQLAKARKNSTQISGMRNAHLRDGIALTRFLFWLEHTIKISPITEISAANQLEYFRRESRMFRGSSFPTISGAGPNGAIVHYRATGATDRILTQNSLYLVDSGAQYPDGTTDITRTIAIGTPSENMRRHFTLVLKGHIAIARAVFPAGTSGSQLDVLARLALWREGLDYDHGTGHGVGSFLSVHEGPQRITKTPDKIALEVGMVVSNEPGFYLTGKYGIRIENLVAVKESQCGSQPSNFLDFETLTIAPIDRHLIQNSLMNNDEIEWLNEYHGRVRREISPHVDNDVLVWLNSATAPL
ncbi:MAG: X-Pro aminopeptidase [Rhodospirillaceae bacterium TMED8]|nr:X-Pro aminopeptidase [Magnetovibrio sp.]OUT49904.1 MAG: X-Pro aminopeptidase [Rhodospirillaceae bacterium TMED8]|tara:strand:+ start:2152 stop:3948 length:1797 start_codon:yes stop_codon:yes gene_type:complete